MQSSKRNYNKNVIIGVVVVFLFISLYSLRAFSPIEYALSILLRPFQVISSSINEGYNNLVNPIRTASTLYEDNLSLQSQNRQLLNEINQLKQQIIDWSKYQDQIDYLTKNNYQQIPAKVIGRTNDPTYRSLIINIGDNEDIAIGQAVVVANGIIVGTIGKLEQNHAEVLLINDSRSAISAHILSEDAPTGIVNGQFSNNLIMDLIPQGKNISVNDSVITSGQEDNLVSGLTIGKVVEVINTPGELFQSALVAPSAIIDNINIVSVIIGTI